jgi:hypothetical protein
MLIFPKKIDSLVLNKEEGHYGIARRRKRDTRTRGKTGMVVGCRKEAIQAA